MNKLYARFYVPSVLDGRTPVPACGSDSYLRVDGRRKFHHHLTAIREHALRQRRGFTHAEIIRGSSLRDAQPVGGVFPLFHNV